MTKDIETTLKFYFYILLVHFQENLYGRYTRASSSLSSSSEQSTPSASPQSPRSPLLDPAVQLSHQAHIRSVYGVGYSGASQPPVFSGGVQTDPQNLQADSPSLELDAGVTVRRNGINSSFTSNGLSSADNKDRSPEYQINLVLNGHEGVNQTKERNAESSDAIKTSIKSSLSSIPQVKNGSLSEDSVQKSVTFAEKLISEEISFDSSSPRYDSGSEDGGCYRHRDSYGADSRQQSEKEIMEKSKSSKTSEIREYFEKLNKQKIHDSSSATQCDSSELQTVSTGHSESTKRSETNLSSDTEMENVAMKILGDVSSHRVAVEFMQKQSLLKSQETNRRIQAEKGAICQSEVFQKKSSRDIQNSVAHLRDSTFSPLLDVTTNSDSGKNNCKKSNSSPQSNLILPQEIMSSPSLLQESKKTSVSGCVNIPVLSSSFVASPIASPSKPSFATNPSHNSSSFSLLRKQPVRPQLSAYSALFPQAGIRPPSPRMSMTSPSLDKPLTSPQLTHMSRGGQASAGSGENSISSDNSEGAESNVQSSVSSGYHSENSGFFCANLQAIPPPNDHPDKGVFTQEFVNRTPSFTYSSGSSSPFSRTSNDDLGSDSSDRLGKTNLPPFTNVYFPNHIPRHKEFVTGNADTSKQPQEPSVPVGVTNNNKGNNNFSRRVSAYRNSTSTNAPIPPTPLVRTNALQLRPESSNSLSSQYSTSSSTLSTIHKPCNTTDSPRVPDRSPLTNTSNRSSDNSILCNNTSPQSTLSYCRTMNSNSNNPPHQLQPSNICTVTKSPTGYVKPLPNHSSNVHDLSSDNTFDSNGHQEKDSKHSRTNDSDTIDQEEADYRTQLGNVQSIMFDSKLGSRMIGHKQFDNPNRKMFKSYEPISCHSYSKDISKQAVNKAGSDVNRITNTGAKETINKDKIHSVKAQQPFQNSKNKVPPYYVLHSSKC